MPNHLTDEQRALGRRNADTALGVTRRDFSRRPRPRLRPPPHTSATRRWGTRPVRAAIIGTGDEGCQAMIRYHNRDYLDFIGYCDIRPVAAGAGDRANSRSHKQYTPADVKKLKQYADHKEMLADPDVEMVVIALPLVLARAGRDRGDEGRQARLQREADGALVARVQGDVSRSPATPTACWPSATSGTTRRCTTTPITWSRTTSSATSATSAPSGTATTPRPRSPRTRTATRSSTPRRAARVRPRRQGEVVYRDSWKRAIPEEDQDIDYKKYGYESLDELIRWRLYNRTGAGPDGRAGQPPARRLLDLPGQEASARRHRHRRHVLLHRRPRGRRPRLRAPSSSPASARTTRQRTTTHDRVIVTYSSINTNAFETTARRSMGSKGTMIVEEEKEILLFKEAGNRPGPRADDERHVGEARGGKPVLETSPSTAGPTAAASLGGLATADPSRGYREELEHFAYCVRHGDPSDFHRFAKLPRAEFEKSAEAKRRPSLPWRGRARRRRHRAHQQHRHGDASTHRVQTRVVRIRISRCPRRLAGRLARKA